MKNLHVSIIKTFLTSKVPKVSIPLKYFDAVSFNFLSLRVPEGFLLLLVSFITNFITFIYTLGRGWSK